MKTRTPSNDSAAISPLLPFGLPPRPPAIEPKWTWHYRTLLRMRDRLQADCGARATEAATPIETHGAHAADSATDEFDHDLALLLLGHDAEALAQVVAAIARIEHGTYGRCLVTGAPIPAARLRALPWCRYLREEEAKLEAAGGAAKAHLPGIRSVRGTPIKIPGTGDTPREGFEHESKLPAEPKSGKATTESTNSAAGHEEID